MPDMELEVKVKSELDRRAACACRHGDHVRRDRETPVRQPPVHSFRQSGSPQTASSVEKSGRS